MLYLRRQHIRRDLFSIHPFRSNLLYSAATNPSSSVESNSAKRSQFENYLINSLGFTKESAISSSSKVSHFSSIQNYNSVVSTFNKFGIDNTQIKDIVSCVPKVLSSKPNKTLEPKIRALHELGFSGSDLGAFLKRCPIFLTYGLHSRIVPTIDYFRKLLGSDERVVVTVSRTKWNFSTLPSLQTFSSNVILLQSYGLSDEEIQKFVPRNARSFAQPTERLMSKLDWVEGKLRISRHSREFFRCFHAIASCSVLTTEKKMQVFKSFGFSDMELSLLFRKQPNCFTLSEDTIRDKLSFFINEVGYTPADLMTCPISLTFSLEKRVKPRYGVFKVLEEWKLVERIQFVTVLTYLDSRFQTFVQRFEDEVPNLYDAYISSIRHSNDGILPLDSNADLNG